MSSLMKDNLPVIIAVSGGTALVATYLYQKSKDSCKHPPGPTSFPFVGNLFQLSTKRNCIPGLFSRWANRYGPVYAVNLGSVSCVVLSNMCTISDAFEGKAHIFSDRPNWLPLMHLIYQERGMVWQNGEPWQDIRHCVMAALGGCGKESVIQCESLEQRVQHEVNKLVREFAKFEEDCRPFCPFELLHKAVCNILCSVVFGCRYKYTSRQFERFICQIRQLAECNILDSTTFFPFLASLPLPRLKTAMGNITEILCFIEKEIQRHRENFDPTCIRDFIDLYLKQCSGTNREHIQVAIIDLFICGAEPTSSALAWAILCMIEFPDIQRRCHEELDNVVSAGRLPELNDKRCLPFVMATLHEVLRRFTVLPLGIPHSTQQDAELCGYTIPCDAVVICNHQAVHLNETAWNNPCEFDPSRFLDEDCDEPRLLRCISNFIPFGLGPRACAGKEFAMDLLFLMFAGLLQRFEFQKGCDCDLSQCFEGRYNFTFAPVPFKVKVRVHC